MRQRHGASMTPAGWAGSAAPVEPGAHAAGRRARQEGDRGRPSWLPVASLETRYRRELLDEILPFWERHGIDRRRGGFMCALDYDGTPVHRNKELSMQGHGIWVYSRLYNQHGANPAWRGIAGDAVGFVLRRMRRPEGTWAVQVTRDGCGIDAGAGADATTEARLYLAEGLQEYAEAAGDVGCLALARSLVLEAAGAGRSGACPEGAHQRAILTVLVGSQMLRRRPDATVQAIVDDGLEAIVHGHYNPQTGLNQEERCGADRSGETATTVVGRSLAALWVVMREARRRGDADLMALCAARIRRHVDVGWDRLHGGLVHALRIGGGGYVWPVERPAETDLEFRFVGEYHYMKTFWSIEALMTAALEVVQWRRERWAVDAFWRAQAVLEEHFSMRPHGHPRYALYADRPMQPPLHASLQDVYHHPRLVMTALEVLGRIRASGRRAL